MAITDLTISQTSLISQVASALDVAGISIDEDSCSVSDLQNKLTKLSETLSDEIEKTINSLAYESFGNFFVITGSLFAQFLGGAAAGLVDNLVNKAIFSNVLGAVNTAVAIVLSAVPGTQLAIQYYAADSLEEELVHRIELSKILQKEINTMLVWLSSFFNFGTKYDLSYLINLKKSYENVREATKIIGAELSAQRISNRAVEKAANHIDIGLEYLTPGYKLINKQISDIHKEFGLTTPVPAVTFAKNKWLNLNDWTNYLKNLWTELKSKYDLSDQKSINELQQIVFKLLPVLPEFLRTFVINTVISTSSEVLVERIPIWALKLINTQDHVNKILTPPKDFLNFLGVNGEKPVYRLFLEEKDITWQRVMNKIRLTESALLLIPTNMQTIEKHNSLVKFTIEPAFSLLKDVYDDMGNSLKSKEAKDPNISQINTLKKFTVWTTKLLSSKSLLNISTGGSGINIKGYGETINLTAGQIIDQLVIIEDALAKLEVFLESKNAGTEPGVSLIEIANKNLVTLIGQSASFIINPSLSGMLISNLRALQVMLRKQSEYDSTELILVRNFKSTVEAFTGFSVIKKYFDSLLKKMQDGNSFITTDLVNSLKLGDLSKVAAYMDTYDFGVSVGNCIGRLIGIESPIPEKMEILDKLKGGLSKLNISKDCQKRFAENIKSLKKKLAMQNILMTQLSDVIKDTK